MKQIHMYYHTVLYLIIQYKTVSIVQYNTTQNNLYKNHRSEATDKKIQQPPDVARNLPYIFYRALGPAPPSFVDCRQLCFYSRRALSTRTVC